MEYFVLGVAKLDVNKSPQKTSDSLVHKIKEVMGILERDKVARACKWFRPRIEEMVAADGNFNEYRQT
jgi:hypothetical protein